MHKANSIADDWSGSRLREIYARTRYLSIKHTSYFAVYERLFQRFVGTNFVFVEIGVLNGGSLHMWREFFGPQARIIGIDLNPAAKTWESAGFEIKIGNQADPDFWDDFYADIGPVDVILDDGGHTNEQQIVTAVKAFENVRDRGLVVVEDTHCSYFYEFGNPYKFSFMSFANRVVDHVHTRNPNVPRLKQRFGETVASIQFFESIVAFEIDRTMCAPSAPTSNNGESLDAKDFRYEGSFASAISALRGKPKFLSQVPLLWRVGQIPALILRWIARAKSRRLRRFFD